MDSADHEEALQMVPVNRQDRLVRTQVVRVRLQKQRVKQKDLMKWLLRHRKTSMVGHRKRIREMVNHSMKNMQYDIQNMSRNAGRGRPSDEGYVGRSDMSISIWDDDDDLIEGCAGALDSQMRKSSKQRILKQKMI